MKVTIELVNGIHAPYVLVSMPLREAKLLNEKHKNITDCFHEDLNKAIEFAERVDKIIFP